ncbi:efflux RND transporter periplasmic adaptor subunit [Uliginosibacterium paludis]|uniref:Biotin/lipoyl-binding protein n=1 Tax=Uliginosibacterium paludis TaxID=1615952 RepID=A0ABV2CTE8_9RHOO
MSATVPNWPLIVSLQQRASLAEDETALGFLIANDSWQVQPYSQACLLVFDELGHLGLRVVSGLASVQEDTPFRQWIQRCCTLLLEKSGRAEGDCTPIVATPAGLDEPLQAGWAEWWPAYVLLVPLGTAREGRLGVVAYVRDTPWLPAEAELLALLHVHYSVCMARLRPRLGWRRYLARWQRRPRRMLWAGALLAAVCLCPVRLSVIAPAEIIALRAEAVAAPTDGVIRSFHVPPNQAVKQGELLFSMDDTTLRNRREVASRSLAVARADALSASQKSFDSPQSRAELASLQGHVREREAELEWLDEMLKRIEVRAPHDGLLIYGDPDDWLGKPVVTGERIAQLAEPAPQGVLVWVPVGDAIMLEPGAKMRVFLQAAPLDALSAELVQTSYQAAVSPEGITAYRVRGELRGGQGTHIGLRGVAKIYGGWQPLVYWVMRRPLGTLRQWVGL